MITAIFSVGYYHFDEHFQILEFAGLKLKLTEAANLPWEYSYQIRPAIQPALAVLIYDFFKMLGINSPFVVATFLRILSALSGFLGMYLIYNAYINKLPEGILRNWFTLLSFFLWFMIFNNVRFSSEGWSGSLFLVGYSIAVTKQSSRGLVWLGVGLIMGLSFLCRYQTGFLIAGFVIWHITIRKNLPASLLITAGIVLMFGAGLLIDRWYYGEWTFTAWNYLYQNIILNQVSNFGVTPWWYYFEIIFFKTIPPFSIVYIISLIVIFVFRRTDLLTWTLFPFLFIHFIIGHKEIRFLFPVIGFLPILIIRSLELIQTKYGNLFTKNKIISISAKLFWIVNIIFLIIVAFKPADNQVLLYRKLYSDIAGPATLYYSDANPYLRGLNICFYKRTDLDIVKIDTFAEIKPDYTGNHFFVTKDQHYLTDPALTGKLIYSTYPQWIKIFNFNNWMSRSDFWYLYEL